MIHPLFRLVAMQPHLLAEHAEAYAELVAEELSKTGAVWKRRVVLGALALILLAVAVVLGGVALMLWAVTPTAKILAPWALLVAPALPALAALCCMFAAPRNSGDVFGDLKQQAEADLAMLREVSAG